MRPALFIALTLLASSALASPPRVIHATPDHADLGVDPTLAAITVEFDQDMNTSGHSICGGGPTFPTLAGKPAWKDARTLVLPVKLDPGRTYAISVNCPAGQSCRNTTGEPAEVYPISFTTLAAGAKPPSLTPDEAHAGAIALRRLLRERYAYENLRKLDWEDVFRRHAEALDGARTPSQFARAAAALLTEANDPHIALRIGDFAIGAVRRPTRPNFDLATVRSLVKDLEQKSPRVWTGSYAGMPYALITDWTGPKSDYEPFFTFIDKVQDSPAIIVDVRPNHGGDERTAMDVAGVFATKTAVYSRHKIKDPAAPTGWQPEAERTVGPTPGRTHFDGRVAVLMGPACMSSNESFLLMMHHAAPRATLVGERSRGSSGNPRPFDLGGGVTVVLPTWVDLTPEGEFVEGKGIEPDVPARSYAGTDGVLGEAFRLLTSK